MRRNCQLLIRHRALVFSPKIPKENPSIFSTPWALMSARFPAVALPSTKASGLAAKCFPSGRMESAARRAVLTLGHVWTMSFW